jgi:hypothetical protein
VQEASHHLEAGVDGDERDPSAEADDIAALPTPYETYPHHPSGGSVESDSGVASVVGWKSDGTSLLADGVG